MYCQRWKIAFSQFLDPVNFETRVGLSVHPLAFPFFELINYTTDNTGIVFFLVVLGHTEVPRGGSKEPRLDRLWIVGEVTALRFLLPRVTSVNPSPEVADDIVKCRK